MRSRLILHPLFVGLLLHLVFERGFAAAPAGCRAAFAKSSDEHVLLQVQLDVDKEDQPLAGVLDGYAAELAALRLHLHVAAGVFAAQGERLTLAGDRSATSSIARLLEEVRAVRGRLEGALSAAESLRVDRPQTTGGAGAAPVPVGLARSAQDPWPAIQGEAPAPSSSKKQEDPWPDIQGGAPSPSGEQGKASSAGSAGDPNDLTDPWPAVGSSGGGAVADDSAGAAPDPWATAEAGSPSSASASMVKNKGSNPWLVLMLVALCIIVMASLVVIVSPMNVQENDGGKVHESKEERTELRVRSRFVQVALPFWTPTAPNSCGLSFLLFFLCAIFTCASLCFWASYVALVVGRTVAPFLVRPDAGAVGHGALGNIPLRIITIVGVFSSPVLWLLRWKDIKGRLVQWTLLSTVIFIILIKNAWSVATSFIMRIFMDSMVFSDAEIFWKCYWVQCGGLVFSVCCLMSRIYLQNVLGLLWREYVTHNFLDLYLARRSYYELDNYRSGSERIDNPDQRIQEDAAAVSTKLLVFAMDLLDSFVGLVSFATVLWNMKPIMTIVAICYSIVGSICGLLVAWKLIVINYITQRSEADFRFSLVHVRNNPEAIAFYGGEAREKRINVNRFEAVMDAIFRRIRWDAAAQGYMSFYTTLATILPPMLLFRSYFHGDLDFGAISQAGQAFITTMTSLSFVVANMHDISDLATAGNRLSSLMVMLRRPDEPSDIKHVNTSETQLRISHLTASVPRAEYCFARGLNFSGGGDGAPLRVLLVGPSGAGKSSLLRVVAGLWKSGSGEIVRPPNADCLFLPQKPYMPMGDLRTQLTYPDEPDALVEDAEVEGKKMPCSLPGMKKFSDADLRSHLDTVGLGGLPDRFDDGFQGVCDWARVLSVGEQQRVASVRIFIRQPKLTILDEATSALPPADEARLYQRLVDANLSYVSVGHRDSLIRYHDRVIELRGSGEWKQYTGKEFAEMQAKRKV